MTKSTSQHTPTPWHSYEKAGMPTELLVRWRVGDPQFCVAGIALSGDSRIDEANAAHIVSCVNAHDALVAALREIAGRPEHEPSDYEGAHERDEIVAIARAALAEVDK